MGKRGPQSAATRMVLVSTAYPIYCDFLAMLKSERRGVFLREEGNTKFFRGVKLPAEPRTVKALFDAKTVRQVRAICRKSAWMAKQPASPLTVSVPIFAKQLLDAKRDRHYPKSDRETSLSKKCWFLAEALAGARFGLSARRSINIIGAGEPGTIFLNLWS